MSTTPGRFRYLAAVLMVLGVATATLAGERMRFEATAYSDPGDETAAGTPARRGVVAADPDVLPIGSRIRIHGAGEYSGEYVVEDVGRAINGRDIDIHMPTDAAAKQFGRRTVEVEVLERGDGRRS